MSRPSGEPKVCLCNISLRYRKHMHSALTLHVILHSALCAHTTFSVLSGWSILYASSPNGPEVSHESMCVLLGHGLQSAHSRLRRTIVLRTSATSSKSVLIHTAEHSLICEIVLAEWLRAGPLVHGDSLLCFVLGSMAPYLWFFSLLLLSFLHSKWSCIRCTLQHVAAQLPGKLCIPSKSNMV